MQDRIELERIRMLNEERIALYSGSNVFISSGVIEKPTLSYNSATMELTVGRGTYRTFLTTDYSGVLKEYTIEETILTLLDNTKYYICATYNDGNPIIYTETDITIANDSAILVIYTIFTEGTELDVLDWGFEGVSLINRINERLIDTDRYGIVYGFGLSATNRIITISGGQFYLGSNKISFSEINSTSNLCELIYRDGSGGFTEQDVLIYPNTQYDNGSGSLATLTDAHYGTIWVYKSAGNPLEMYSVLGTGSYANLELAKQAKRPSEIPEKVALGSFLCGVVIFQKGSTTATVLSAFDTVFNANAPSIHNSLLSLQGGIAGEYYHMSLAEHTAHNKLISVFTNASKAVVYENAIHNHSITQIGVYQKLIIPFLVKSKSADFTIDTINNRLLYTGVMTKEFLFNASASVLNSGTPNMSLHFVVIKNGNVQLTNTESATKLDSASSITSINASNAIDLSQNDYIEIWAYSDKANNFSTNHMQLQLTEYIPNTFNNM